MGIKFHCPNGHKLNVKSFLAGKRGICPQCGEKFEIPGKNQANPTPRDSIAPEAKSATTDNSSSLSTLSPIATTDSAVSTDHQTIASGMPSSDAEKLPPASAESPVWATKESIADPFDRAPDATWYVRPATGGQFGPAAPEMMRTWLLEGRVGTDSMVWREGWDRWKDAGMLFPFLKQTSSPSAEAPTPSPIPPSTEVAVDMAQLILPGTQAGSAPSRTLRPTGSKTKSRISLFLVIALVMVIIGLLPILVYVAIWH